MKNNRITLEVAQERMDNLYGDRIFTVLEWNGTKGKATVLFGEWSPLKAKIIINRGEYLYRTNMIPHMEVKLNEAIRAQSRLNIYINLEKSYSNDSSIIEDDDIPFF